MKHEFNLDKYTTFLIANGNKYSGVEVSKALALKNENYTPAHDSISRWLAGQTFKPENLWDYVKAEVSLKSSLIVDDTTLDKRWSPKNELVGFHWSGNEHKTIRGISLVNLLATSEDECIPIDYRVYGGKEKDKNKNEHFIDMLNCAKERGFKPDYVMADCWYGSLENMKKIVKLGWKFIFGLKENRLVNETEGDYVAVSTLDWTKKRVRRVWLKGFGFVMVAQIVFKNGDMRYIATNDLSLTDYETFSGHAKKRWTIEEFHRGIKQTTGIEKCYSIKKQSQLTHIFSCFVAFIKLEFQRLKTGISWYEQKAQAVRLGISGVFA
jgi:putative transposase